MSLKHQPRTEDELTSGLLGQVLMLAVIRAGGEMRLRFGELGQHRLSVFHDAETDELVLLAACRDEIKIKVR